MSVDRAEVDPVPMGSSGPVGARAVRLVGGLLSTAWLATAGAALVGYRPGGLVDWLPALLALPPAAAAALVALPRGPRGAFNDATARLIGLAAGVGGIFLLVGIASSLAGAPGPSPSTDELDVRRLLPGPSTALALGWAVALTGLFAAAARQRAGTSSGWRAWAFPAGGAGLASLGYAGLAGLILAWNAGTVAAPTASPFGPVQRVQPPGCAGRLPIGPHALVREEATGRVDDRGLGTVSLTGERRGARATWTARYATAWGDGAAEATGDTTAPQLDDAAVGFALSADRRLIADDLGLELVGGVLARHCRLVTDGTSAVLGFLALRWLAGANAPDEPAPGALGAWRGNLDYWIFGDGQLGLAAVAVDGGTPNGWPIGGIRAFLRATLVATERASP